MIVYYVMQALETVSLKQLKVDQVSVQQIEIESKLSQEELWLSLFFQRKQIMNFVIWSTN